jgi:hypothetical protein
MYANRRPCEDKGKDWSELATSKEAREWWQPVHTGKKHWSVLSLVLSDGIQPCQHNDCGLLSFRTVKKQISIVLSHLVCSNCVIISLGNKNRWWYNNVIYFMFVKIINEENVWQYWHRVNSQFELLKLYF